MPEFVPRVLRMYVCMYACMYICVYVCVCTRVVLCLHVKESTIFSLNVMSVSGMLGIYVLVDMV